MTKIVTNLVTMLAQIPSKRHLLRSVLLCCCAALIAPKPLLLAGQRTEFWNCVTNLPEACEFIYSRSNRESERTEPKAGLYIAPLVFLHVKLQSNGCFIRYSDKLKLTNNYEIGESFHFAVGGFGTNLWQMGAARQITYWNATQEELANALKPLRKTVIIGNNRKHMLEQLKSITNNIDQRLVAYVQHRENAYQILRLGMPAIQPATLRVERDFFSGLDFEGQEISGDLKTDTAGRISSINFRNQPRHLPGRLEYKYDSNTMVPNEFTAFEGKDENAKPRYVYRIHTIQLLSKQFTPEDLSPTAYLAANVGMRQFVRSNSLSYFISKNKQLVPVQVGNPGNPSRKGAVTMGCLFILTSIGIIIFFRLTKQ